MSDKIPSEIKELVEAILIIGARRANDSLTYESAKPLIEQHIDRLSERVHSLASKTIDEKDDEIGELKRDNGFKQNCMNISIQQCRENQDLIIEQASTIAEMGVVIENYKALYKQGISIMDALEKANDELVAEQQKRISELEAENDRLKEWVNATNPYKDEK